MKEVKGKKEIKANVLLKLFEKTKKKRVEWAKEIGTSPANVTRFLDGTTKNTSLEMFERMARSFGLSVDELSYMMISGKTEIEEEEDMTRIESLEKEKAYLQQQLDRLTGLLERALPKRDDTDQLTREIENLKGEIERLKKDEPHFGQSTKDGTSNQ